MARRASVADLKSKSHHPRHRGGQNWTEGKLRFYPGLDERRRPSRFRRLRCRSQGSTRPGSETKNSSDGDADCRSCGAGWWQLSCGEFQPSSFTARLSAVPCLDGAALKHLGKNQGVGFEPVKVTVCR